MSNKAIVPELKKYLDKQLYIKLNGDRTLTGSLRGFDPFMNIVLDDAEEEVNQTDRRPLGLIVVRGNSIVLLEAHDKV